MCVCAFVCVVWNKRGGVLTLFNYRTPFSPNQGRKLSWLAVWLSVVGLETIVHTLKKSSNIRHNSMLQSNNTRIKIYRTGRLGKFLLKHLKLHKSNVFSKCRHVCLKRCVHPNKSMILQQISLHFLNFLQVWALCVLIWSLTAAHKIQINVHKYV